MTAFDLVDLAATLAPRLLTMFGTLDQMREPLAVNALKREYAFAYQIYNSVGEKLIVR